MSTDIEKLQSVLDEIGIPYKKETEYYLSLQVDQTKHGSITDIGIQLYFDDTDNFKFIGLEGMCYRDHPQDYDPWDE